MVVPSGRKGFNGTVVSSAKVLWLRGELRAALALEQFEVCLHTPDRFLARKVPAQERVSLCLFVLQDEPQRGGIPLLGAIHSSHLCRQPSPRSAWLFRQLIMVLL